MLRSIGSGWRNKLSLKARLQLQSEMQETGYKTRGKRGWETYLDALVLRRFPTLE